MVLLICVELDKIPLLHKLKQLYKHLPVGFLINITYTANNILLYTKMFISRIRNCDHVTKMLYSFLMTPTCQYLLKFSVKFLQ